MTKDEKTIVNELTKGKSQTVDARDHDARFVLACAQALPKDGRTTLTVANSDSLDVGTRTLLGKMGKSRRGKAKIIQLL